MSKVSEAGDELFALFERMVPPPRSRDKRQNALRSEVQVSQSLERFYAEARKLREKHRLGLFSRARVIRYFQGRMISKGYETDLVKRVILALILSAFVGRAG